MRKLWLLTVALGCTASPPYTGIPIETSMKWMNPKEAEDLDPDPDIVRIALTAESRTFEINGESVEGFSYNGQTPGPTIRLQKGNRLEVTLTNGLDTETTIHWHGLHVPYEMDGVTWTQEPIGVGESFTYAFTVEQVGTYWYHPHFDTERQVDLGLYGLLIVEDPEAPKADREVHVVFDSWGEWEPSNSHNHLGHIDTWTANGITQPQIPVEGGEVVRMRVLNASNVGYLDLSGSFEVIASDQGWLPAAQSPDSLVLSPGDRTELTWGVGEEDLVLQHTPYALHGGTTYAPQEDLLRLNVENPSPEPAGLAWPTLAGSPTPDAGTVDLIYSFQGDDSSGVWMINGEVFPDVTVHALPLNAEAIIELRNLSASEHPFHLHGHAFEVLSINDVPSTYRRIEDTINLVIRDKVRIRLVANNPGYWMTHCHILPHAHGGMMTVLEVLDAP